MARIRSVKPELRTSELVATWPIEVRYFWVLLWGYFDDYGRGIDSAKAIAGDCFPWDDDITTEMVDGWLNLLSVGADGKQGPICRYTVAGKRYVHAVNWHEHQKPNRPTDSRLPACPHPHSSLTESLTEPVGESLSESLSGLGTDSVTESLHVGAAAGSSRGAGQQQQEPRESRTAEPPRTAAAAEKIILAALADAECTVDEARSIADQLTKDRKPRNLPGLVRTIAEAGELPDLLAGVRKRGNQDRTKLLLVEARAGPECEHLVPGGAALHPKTQLPLCPNCRTAAQQALEARAS